MHVICKCDFPEDNYTFQGGFFGLHCYPALEIPEIPLVSLVFKTPYPLRISSDPSWAGYGYFWNHTI